MSSSRYLEFDSSYRDRNLYPEPANFVVEMSQTGQKIASQALDPVCDASPILVWNNSFREDAANVSVSITGVTFTNSTTDSSILLVTAGAGQLRTLKDFYCGAILSLTDATPTTIRRRIVSYDLITTGSAQITVDSPYTAGFNPTSGNIQNPTNATDVAVVPQLYIPFSRIPIDNFYKGYYVTLETGDENRLITSYDGTTHLATLASNTATDWSTANQNFTIRKALPCVTGAVNTTDTAYNVIGFDSTDVSSVSGTYVGSFIRIIEPLPTAPFSTTVAPYSEERRIRKYIAGDGLITSVSGANVGLGYTASSENDYYVGCLISINGTTQTIIAYNGTTKIATLDSATGVVGDDWNIRSAFLTSWFTAAVPDATEYEIELYTRDNSVPFVYTGTLVSSQQETCYEVELLNLILPNLTMASGRGGRPAFYPYLYVELEMKSTSGSSEKNIIYSNNPNATKMLFRAVVDDTPTPLISPFIKIDGDGMVHTIKFKPNTTFKFAVYHADGQLFKTVMTDFYSPTQPNPLVQISACFAFKPK